MEAMHTLAFTLEITDRGSVFCPEQEGATFPFLCILPGGRWLCAFRLAPKKESCVGQRVLLTWSDDEGTTWSPPWSPWTPPVITGRAGNFRIAACTALGGDEVVAVLAWVDQSRPEREFFDPTTNSLLDMRMFLSRSKDGGKTWSPPQPLNSAPLVDSTPITGPLLVLPDGTWVCQYETNKPYDTLGEWVHKSCFIFSEDEGRTWRDPVAITNSTGGVFLWDQRPGLMPDGSVLDFFWTFDDNAKRYLNIHASRSDDGGHTWSATQDTGVPGQPAQPVTFGDGLLAMVYVDRTGPPQIKARLSADGGMLWENEVVLAASAPVSQTRNKKGMGEAWDEMAAFSLGLPCTASCANGDIAVVYYSGSDADHTAIEWVRLSSR